VVEATESHRSQRNLTHQPCTELRKVSRAVYASRFGSFARGTVGRRCFAFSAEPHPRSTALCGVGLLLMLI
jgi:hypothetical protein